MTVKIGLETHITLDLATKLFCKCKNQINSQINTNICEICLGEPGTLPSVNLTAVDLTILTANLLNCDISKTLSFDRKHYIYPDLPKGYQLTQFYNPFAINGNLTVFDQSLNQIKNIKITKIQLEEDPCSLDLKHRIIDYNRSGRALIEIVTNPDFTNSEEVIFYLKTLLCKLESAKICNTKFGSVFRCDVNISTKHHDRVEIKNIGSLFEIEKAISFEIKRQSCEKGDMHTRSWNSITNKTQYSRPKESEFQYGYLREYNIADIPLTKVNYNKVSDIYYRFTNLKTLFENKYVHKTNNKQFWSLAQDLNLYLFFQSLDFNINYTRLIELMYRFKQRFSVADLIAKTSDFLKVNEFSEKKYIHFIFNSSNNLESSVFDKVNELKQSDKKFSEAMSLLAIDFNHKSKSYVIGKLSTHYNYEFAELELIIKNAINHH